jgi:hypothetical protein
MIFGSVFITTGKRDNFLSYQFPVLVSLWSSKMGWEQVADQKNREYRAMKAERDRLTAAQAKLAQAQAEAAQELLNHYDIFLAAVNRIRCARARRQNEKPI